MANGNLLIIDDEVKLLERTALLLEDITDNVFTADNGQRGLDILNRETVHCILCDINMPEMNGIDVLKKVRQKFPDLPFIFYTGHGSRELMKEAIKLGAFDFIDKPFLEGLESIVESGLKLGLGDSKFDSEDTIEDVETEFKKLFKSKV